MSRVLLLALCLGTACDDGASLDGEAGRCPSLDIAIGETVVDPVACTRCTCHAENNPGCVPLPGCTDASVGRLDGGGGSADSAMTAVDAGAALPPNVVVLVDTSASMNEQVSDRTPAELCAGADCPPWDFPNCDAPDAPQTRLGRLKVALRNVVTGDPRPPVTAALFRFPQRRRGESECAGGFLEGLARMSGHGAETTTSFRQWFGQNLDEVAVARFDSPTRVWAEALDFFASAEDAELSAHGPSPLGVSIFYATEYLRHTVLAEDDAPALVLVIADGADSAAQDSADFFHPRVQAKRARFGDGCLDADDCTGGASCDDGACRPPAGAVDAPAMLCSTLGTPCRSGGDCNGSACRAFRIDHGARANLPRSVEVRLLDLSGIPDAHAGLVAYGGGRVIRLGAPSVADLEAALRQLLAQ